MSDFLLMLPTLNEEEALLAIAPEIPKAFDVIVVDGGSTDKTEEVAKKLGYKFIRQKFGKGKGCGVRTGMEWFLASDYKYFSLIDADNTNDPKELCYMYEKLQSNGYDIVLGDRDRRLQKELLGWFSLFINSSTSDLTSFAYKSYLPDIQTGYWIYRKGAVKKIYPMLTGKGFEIEYDIVYHSWKEGLKVTSHPVTFRKRLGKTKFSVYLRFKQIYYGCTYVAKSLWVILRRKLSGKKP